jgi:hypothetical protein
VVEAIREVVEAILVAEEDIRAAGNREDKVAAGKKTGPLPPMTWSS